MSFNAGALGSGAVRRARFPSFREDGRTDPATPRDAEAVDAGGPRSRAAESDALRARARAEAFEAGAREGRAASLAEWAARLSALAESLDEAGRRLTACREGFVAEADRQLPRLLLLLARKVLQRELATPAAAVETLVRVVAERIAGCDRPVAVRLSPADAEAFHAACGTRGVRVDADPALGAGEWVLETGEGFLDGRIESQLEEAWRLLAEEDR